MEYAKGIGECVLTIVELVKTMARNEETCTELVGRVKDIGKLVRGKFWNA